MSGFRAGPVNPAGPRAFSLRTITRPLSGPVVHMAHLTRITALAAVLATIACLRTSDGTEPLFPGDGRLTTTWSAPTSPLGAGSHPLGLGASRDGFLRIPEGHDPSVPAPLVLLLHGAGRGAGEWTGGLPLFEELGMIVLAVDSRDATWEIVYGGFGPDTEFIDRALAFAFDAARVDPDRIFIAGFSDGASYALSLGRINGDLFTRVLAFSPGFMVDRTEHGRPPIFISHGTTDGVLPVTGARTMAERLRGDGYVVRYHEFDGGHALPYEIGALGFGWALDAEPAEGPG